MLGIAPFRHMGVASCVAAPLAAWPSPVRTKWFCSRSPAVIPCLGIRSAGRASSWPWPLARVSRASLSVWNATQRPSGEQASVTLSPGWRACWPITGRGGPGEQPGFPPLQKAQIIQLACLEPIARGLHITHWSSEDLARQAVVDGIIDTISPRSVCRILQEVDLQPHRTRFWKTARLNAQFMERAVRILWCYTYAQSLARRGYWVVCTDELPNFQVLERVPIRRAIPGSIEQREFEYTRHGTVCVLVFLIVHSGKMEAMCFPNKSAVHYTSALRHFRRRHHHLRGVYLIHDGDSTHTGDCTPVYLSACRSWWRPRLLPPHASWLNQAESLLEAFEFHYLKRGSWRNQDELIRHVETAWPEYNRLYAHPFDWEWTIPMMKRWFAKHAP
jgi:hypothetical protein